MLKLIGGMLIICSSTSVSVMFLNYKREQINSLDEIISIISLIINSVSRSCDTEKILRLIEHNDDYRNFIFNEKSVKYLDSDIQKKFKEVFSVLGKSDAEAQLEIMKDALAYYKDEKEEYEEHYKTHKKLYLSLGIISGIMISILLI